MYVRTVGRSGGRTSGGMADVVLTVRIINNN